MNGAICDGGAAFLRRRIAYCPTEDRRRRFVTRSQAWYGTEWTCLGCGDSWLDGERGYRPFERGWRARAVARARQLWDSAGTYDPAAFRTWLEGTFA